MRYLTFLFFLFLAAGCSVPKPTVDYVFASKNEKSLYLAAYNKALKLWDVPFEETDIVTSYGTAHVIMCGPKTGEPVVLFHGMDASSTMWFPNVKHLSQKNRVYAIDFPLEAGKSMACGKKLRNSEINLFYNEIFNHFEMKNINLVAASRGGWMATYLTLNRFNDIKRLILLSPAQTFGGIQKPGKVLKAVALKLFPSRKRLDKFFDAFSVYPDKIDAAYKEQFFLANVYGSSRPNYINMTLFSRKELQSIKIPVLLLVGDHDVVNGEKTLEKAKKLIPNLKTGYIKNAGHFLSIDQSEIINAKIVDFLSKN